MPETAPPSDAATLFAFFNEVGIINQLATAMFEARLPQGILVSQFAVLNHLIRVQDGRTPLALARAFQVPKTTMTHTLAVLERHGLVRLAANPGDGRSKCVWISDAGRAFRDAAITTLRPEMVALTKLIPVDEIAAVVPVLTALRKVMDARRNSPNPTPPPAA